MTAELEAALTRLVAEDGPDRALIAIKAQPRPSCDQLDGVFSDAAGRPMLRIRTTAAPADGAANKAIERSLAKALRLPRSAVRIVSGATSREKRARVSSPAATARAALVAHLVDAEP